MSRECGDCSECCRYELPDSHACPFLVPDGKGCGVYERRPPRCHDFLCSWVRGAGDESLRPDRTHVVFAEPKPTSPLREIARNPVVGYYDSGRLDPADALEVARRLHRAEWLHDYDLIGIGDFRTKEMYFVGDMKPTLLARAIVVRLGDTGW